MVTSIITFTEVLPKPMELRRHDVVNRYRNFLFEMEGITLLEVNNDIAQKAAELRAKYGMKTPDALHVATALNVGASVFPTNDFQLQRINDLPILILDDLEL